MPSSEALTLQIAVEGCCHGELDAIYARVAELEHRNNYKVDLLLICGDFEAIRNHQDLQCMAVPAKYRQLGGFHKYVSIQSFVFIFVDFLCESLFLRISNGTFP